MNNKISEKAVWDNGITADEPDYMSTKQSIQTSVQSHPQMMFCYNCNQVIPSDSAFCPWCKTELFTKCPKCGKTYSSQYTFCYSCGVNKDEYLEEQELLRLKEEQIRQEKEWAIQKEIEIAEKRKLRFQQIQSTKEYDEVFKYLRKMVDRRSFGGLILHFLLEFLIICFGIAITAGGIIGLCSGEDSIYIRIWYIICVVVGFSIFVSGLIYSISKGVINDSDEFIVKNCPFTGKLSLSVVRDVVNPSSKNYYEKGTLSIQIARSFLDLSDSQSDL